MLTKILIFLLILKKIWTYPLRPFYLISHMANTLAEVDEALSGGANAIEADVHFSFGGKPLSVFHGIPCDCGRYCYGSTPFIDYLYYVRNIGNPKFLNYNPRFSLLYLDLKIDFLLQWNHVFAGETLAQYLIKYFFQSNNPSTKIKVILGIPSTKDEIVFRGFLRKIHPDLKKYIGFDVSSYERISTIRRMYARLGVSERAWQGDGISNCFKRTSYRLHRIIQLRKFKDDYINKVYVWTVDRKRSIRQALRLNIDGIISNKVSNVAEVLREIEFYSKYRLATNSDNPWTKFKGK